MAPASDGGGAGTIAWQIQVAGDSTTDTLELRGPGKGTGWSLLAGQGASLDDAMRAMRPAPLAYQPFQMRIFDVRGRTVLFAENFGTVTYFDLDTGTWQEGVELASAQPDYVARLVPEFTSLWVESENQTPTLLPAYP